MIQDEQHIRTLNKVYDACVNNSIETKTLLARMGLNKMQYFIVRKVLDGRQPIIIWVGSRGSGKTWGALTVGESICKVLSSNLYVCYTLEDMITNIKKALRGDVLIFDEVGLTLNRQNWQSIENRIFSMLSQIDRYKNFITFLILPNLNFLSTAHILLCDYMCKSTVPTKFGFYRAMNSALDTRKRVYKTEICFYSDVKPPSQELLERVLPLEKANKDRLIAELQAMYDKRNSKPKQIVTQQSGDYEW